MLKLRLLFFFGILGWGTLFVTAPLSASSDFDFLDTFDTQPWPFVPERDYDDGPEETADPVPADLDPFLKDFEADGTVSIYLGYGIGTYHPARGAQIFDMLKALGVHYKLSLVDWKLSRDNGLISFRDQTRGIQYSITIGYERNEYIRAFSNYEVVMYHGHSRYGQGPAFQGYQNYFRMGRNFKAVEVDTRNIYFRNEQIVKTDRFPVRDAVFGSARYPFQYRGGKSKMSKLPKTSYTKNIPGMDVDLVNTRFLKGRQIFYFYSCKNRRYWRDAIRGLHPDIQQKLVFGTFKDGRGASKPEALMIISLVNRQNESSKVLELLNTTKDCDQCFTTF